MIDPEELAEIVLEALRERAAPVPPAEGKRGFFAAQPFNVPFTTLPKGRRFISEHEVKKTAAAAKSFRLPRGAILSPLAEDWLQMKGIRVERE